MQIKGHVILLHILHIININIAIYTTIYYLQCLFVKVQGKLEFPNPSISETFTRTVLRHGLLLQHHHHHHPQGLQSINPTHCTAVYSFIVFLTNSKCNVLLSPQVFIQSGLMFDCHHAYLVGCNRGINKSPNATRYYREQHCAKPINDIYIRFL